MVLQFNIILFGHINLKYTKGAEYSDISESTNVIIQSQYAFKFQLLEATWNWN